MYFIISVPWHILILKSDNIFLTYDFIKSLWIQPPLFLVDNHSFDLCKWKSMFLLFFYFFHCSGWSLRVIEMDNENAKDKIFEKFTWRIRNFSTLDSKPLYSEEFFLDNHTWCLIEEFLSIIYVALWLDFHLFFNKFRNFIFRSILIYPKGNKVAYLSIYLDAGDPDDLPHGRRKYANFKLALVNQVHDKYNDIEGIFHTYISFQI